MPNRNAPNTSTAKPKSARDARPEIPDTESGLSVDTEDLARRALSEATEAPAPTRDLDAGLTDPPRSDEAPRGTTGDEDRTLWEQTVDDDLERESDERTSE